MKLGYIGPFGDSNFGDYAMLINDILDIGIKDIVIFTYDIDNTRSVCEMYLKEYMIEYVFIDIEKPEINYCKEYIVEYNIYPFIPMEIYNKIKNADEVFEKIKNIDKLIVVGGGYFNHLWNAKHRQYKLLAIMGVILKTNEYRKKIYFLGNTYGPFSKSTEMFKIFFSNLTNVKIGTRDDVFSPLWFKTVSEKELYIIPDDLYFLNKFIMPTNYERKNKYIVLEVYYSINELEKNIDLYRRFIRNIKEKYLFDVVFLPFDKQYGGEKQGEFLSKNISELEYFSIKNDRFIKIEDTLGLVKNASFIICNRYHLFVFAVANNIPVIQILKDVLGNKTYYYTKSKGILNQVFKDQYCDEELFFSLSVKDCFDSVVNNLEEITVNQNKLFNGQKNKNEKIMLKKRNEFLNMIRNNE